MASLRFFSVGSHGSGLRSFTGQNGQRALRPEGCAVEAAAKKALQVEMVALKNEGCL